MVLVILMAQKCDLSWEISTQPMLRKIIYSLKEQGMFIWQSDLSAIPIPVTYMKELEYQLLLVDLGLP